MDFSTFLHWFVNIDTWISLSFYMDFSKRLQHHLEHRHQSLLAGCMVYTTDQSALCQQSDSNYQHLSTLVADQWSLIILMLMIMMMTLLLFLRKGCDKREEWVVGKEHQGGPPPSSPSPPLPSSPSSSLSSPSLLSKKTRWTVMGKARTTDRKGYSAHQCTFNGRGGDGVMVLSLQLFDVVKIIARQIWELTGTTLAMPSCVKKYSRP